MKLSKIALITLLTATTPSFANNLSSCSFNGIPLYGKVKVVNAYADKVQVVNNYSDLDVKLVDHYEDSCGKWKFVDNYPDFKVQFVDHYGDIKIRFVDNYSGLK